MHWKFDPFFSIEILHGKYPPPAVGQAAPPAPVFSVEPTGNTLRRLLHMGWVFRPRIAGGGGTLFAEKIFGPDDIAKLHVTPMESEGFTFMIRLSEASLLNETKPFDAVPATLPPFSGRARTLYFDNLHAVSTGTDTFSLTAGGAVGLPEFGSRVPTHFMYRSDTAGVTQVDMTPLVPGGHSIPFPLNAKTRSVEINLPENGYELTKQPAGQSEKVFLIDETLPSNTIGIVRIFQPPGADWEPFRRYQIFFDKA